MAIRFRHGGTRVAFLAQTQWAPTLTVHDPQNVITIDSPAAGGDVECAGTSPGTSTAGAAITLTQALTGSTTATSTTAATIAATQGFSGSSQAAATAIAAITIAQSLAGTSPGAASATSDLSGSQPLSGSSPGTSTASASISGSQALTASAAGTSTAVADLDNTEVTASLSGTITGAATATAALTLSQSLAGSAAAVASGTGDLVGLQSLAGIAEAGSTASASLTAIVSIAGSAAGAATATGDILRVVLITGSSSGTSAVAPLTFGSLAQTLEGFSDGYAVARALHVRLAQLLGGSVVTCEATASADLDRNYFQGRADGTSGATVALLGSTTLAGSASGVSFARERRSDLRIDVVLRLRRAIDILVTQRRRADLSAVTATITISLEETPMITGNVVTLTAKFRDASGALFDPLVVDLRVKANSKLRTFTYAAGDIVRVSVGTFTADVLLEEAGRHSYGFRSTSPGQEASAEGFFVVDASALG